MGNKRILIVGGGHAGIEAAFALARMKIKSTIITMDTKALGRLSCNPAIGGLAKSHLVKEIDALGGIMGHAADQCSIQRKTLNKTKGRAVWALRAQVDKKKYPIYVQKLIKNNKYISVVEDEALSIITKAGSISALKLKKLKTISCRAAVVTCGTFLNGLIHIGMNSFRAGRMGEKGSYGLTESLVDHGMFSGRLKTGTPPRISRDSINFAFCSDSPGDSDAAFFSLFGQKTQTKNEPCLLINTNTKTHSIISESLNESAMFSGRISGVGPRYCPSIEDKIYRFKSRVSHHLFLEPEWFCSDQIYVSGFSTSLPEHVQIKALKSIEALRDVRFVRPGYAIEYDYIPPRQLRSSLESKVVGGLFLAGQMNGTSGYEEAAAQGLIAGINAGMRHRALDPFCLDRSASYIGVMIDDLITSHLDEPYRMFTSRAEHRLFLRSDNAYSRLSRDAINRGIITPYQKRVFGCYFNTLLQAESFVEQKILYNNKKTKLKTLIKRPQISINSYSDPFLLKSFDFSRECLFETETNIKYEGYIQNEIERINKNKKMEALLIPGGIVYKNISGLSNESVERLSSVMPETLGQASRISGIRPTDITLIGSFIKNKLVSRET